MEVLRETDPFVIVVETDYSRVFYYLFRKEGIYFFRNHTLIGFLPITQPYLLFFYNI